ncbi:MAG: hypothetical protein NDJ94_06725 [Vicinamibacteria bacterium]|jgi:ABC-type transporter Mla subunit MlaD|nr:hypothetical protein [Vicinamibacteria bacterium]
MSELAQQVSELGTLIPDIPDQLGELIRSARSLDERTDALADELDRAHELLAEQGPRLHQQLAAVQKAAADAEDGVAGALARLEASARAAHEASDTWSAEPLREAAARLDDALESARDHLATGAEQMEEARQLVSGEVGGLRARADEVAASVQQSVAVAAAGVGEMSAAVAEAETAIIADAERMQGALDELVAAMGQQATALLDAAVAARDQAVAQIHEASATLDGQRAEATTEVEQQVAELARTMSDAVSRLHAVVDSVNGQLAQAAASLRPVREEYERLSEAFGWSEQPLNTMIGEVRRAADQAGIPFV